jgi:dephospho-CoA kinase
MRTIGLTGGIAMGKTTVSDYLASQGCVILDADLYAREAVAPGSPILQQLTDRYGKAILLPTGSLSRPQLAEILFTKPEEKAWIEGVIHPFVLARLEQARDQAIQTQPENPVVLVIPLLFEAGMTDLVEEIWVVYCPRVQQLERLMRRDQLTLEQAEARLLSQWPIEQKCDLAHLVIHNSSALDALYAQLSAAIHPQDSI